MEIFFERHKNIRSSHISRAFFALLIVLSGMIMFSCSNVMNGVVSQKTGVSIIVTNFSEVNTETERSLAPSTLLISDIDNFTITGEDLNGKTINQAITINSDGTGIISDVSISVWILTLHAYKDGAEVMCGYATVDTRTTWEVSFTLSSEGVNASGGFDLTFIYSDSSGFSSVYQIDVSLCDSTTLESVYTFGTISGSANLAKWTGSGYSLTGSGIDSGYYILVIKFYGLDSNSIATQIGVYSDVVCIEPNRTTTKTVTISNDILYKKPDAPSDLYVYRDDSSLSSDYYTAVIRWTDNASNEEYNILKVYTYSNTSNVDGTLTATIDYSNHQSLSIAGGDAIGYAGGSLLYSSTEYALKLKTGVLYDFVLYSANSMGVSASISRKASSDIANDETYGKMTGFGLSESAPYKRVNSFYVNYNYNGGTMLTSAAISDGLRSKMEYYVYEGSAITLFQPEEISDAIKTSGDINDFSESESYPVLFFGSPDYYFTKWTEVTGLTEISTVSSCNNINVYAQYYEPATITLSLDSGVTAYYGATSSASLPANGTSFASGQAISAGYYITLAVDLTASSNSIFSKFVYYVNGVEQYTDSSPNTSSQFTFCAGLKGNYTIQIAGYYEGAYYYSQELVFSVN